jgi:hypothetical protein
MAKKKAAAQRVEDTSEPVAAQTPATPQAEAPSEPQPRAEEVNPFPRVIHTAVINPDYKLRLMQVSGEYPEMRIQFGSGQRGDKPSDAVLDIIRSQVVPEELMTKREREAGQPVPWFKFRTEEETGEGTWRMWMRNHAHTARTKAEEVFNDVVKQVKEEVAALQAVGPQQEGPEQHRRSHGGGRAMTG